LIVTPFARIASTCAGHCSMKTTSSPASVRSAPIDAPFAPVPTIAILRAATSVPTFAVRPIRRLPLLAIGSRLMFERGGSGAARRGIDLAATRDTVQTSSMFD